MFPEITSDDLKMLAALGVAPSLMRRLMGEAHVTMPDGLTLPEKPASTGLSPSEASILRSGGAAGLDESQTEIRAIEYRMALTLLRDCREMVNQCYRLEAVAGLLQISQAAVRDRATNTPRDLYAFQLSDDGQWLFPHWQFTSSGPIPGLDRVLAVARVSLNPLVVSRIMLMKSVDLENDSERFSPRDWLLQGFDPDPVIMLFRDL